jgi:hypothetical protein
MWFFESHNLVKSVSSESDGTSLKFLVFDASLVSLHFVCVCVVAFLCILLNFIVFRGVGCILMHLSEYCCVS